MLSCLRSLPIRSARLWSAFGVESGGHQRGDRCVRFVAREPRGGTTCSRRRITPDRALRARNVLRAHSTAPSAQGFRRVGPRFLDGTVSATILAVEPASLQGVHSRIDRPRGHGRRRVRCTCRCNRGRLRRRTCQLRSPGAEDLRAVRGPFAASPVIQAKRGWECRSTLAARAGNGKAGASLWRASAARQDRPPSTERICPETHPVASAAKKSVAWAISSGVPSRRAWIDSTNRFWPSGP